MKKLIGAILLSTCMTPAVFQPARATDWPMFGQNVDNTALGEEETIITPRNVGSLKPKWVFTTGGDVSARAAVVDGIVYFPDWGGNLWALHADTGKVLWHHQISDYGLPANTMSRTSPAVVGNILYIGTQSGATLLAIYASTGNLVWKKQLDPHPQAVLTGSPAVFRDVVYTGVSSLEESAAATSNYPCCSFRGSVIALNATTGKTLWKTMTAPPGYAGGSVWGSNPVVDPARKAVFIGTGDNYMKPTAPAYASCIAHGGTEPTCLSHDDHPDSMLSLDMATGKIKWAKRLISNDDWNVACAFDMPGVGNCPQGAGPDYDFGSAPNMFKVTLPGSSTPTTVIGAGQKSGIYATFNADTGKLLWAQRVGPGSFLGGIEWGSAVDGHYIYVALCNFAGKRYANGRAGSWSALDPATGKIVWQVPDPNGSIDIGPMAVADGVVYAPSMAAGPGQSNMFALSSRTGEVLWSYNSGGSVLAGAVISGGVVYWGSGYSGLGTTYLNNNKFYAFSLDGK